MAYNTGNPIGSTSPKDLSDNARNQDLLMLGDDPSYPDRKGLPRKSWKGMEAEHSADQFRRATDFSSTQADRKTQFTKFMESSGYEAPVSYAAGLELERATQTVTFMGNEYRVKSQFLPLTTIDWATDESKLKLIGDSSLRQNISSTTDPTKGAGMVGWVRSRLRTGVQHANTALDAIPVSIWEAPYVMLITDKPTDDPDTWVWTPAIIECLRVNGYVRFPAGFYNFDGAGVDIGSNWRIEGDHYSNTTINLGPTSYLIDSNSVFNAIRFSGFTVNGGYGAIRSKGTGNLVGTTKDISYNRFRRYTRCAVSHNAWDNPYWSILHNQFDGLDTIATMGAALGRNSDCSVFGFNTCIRNKVHFKCYQSGRVTFVGNDFIQFGPGAERISVWLTASDNSQTLIVTGNDNKFGNENLGPTDYRVAILPELPGALNGDRLPDFSGAEALGVYILDFQENMVVGGGPFRPFVYSASNRIRGGIIGSNKLLGARPSWLLEYSRPEAEDSYVTSVVFSNNLAESYATGSVIRTTNRTNNTYVADPAHLLEGVPTLAHSQPGLSLDRAGYVELLTTRANNLAVVTATRVGSVADVLGGTEAAEYDLSAINSEIRAAFSTAPTPNRIIWCQLDLAQGVTGVPATRVRVQVFLGSNAYWSRSIELSVDWSHFQFPLSLSNPTLPLVRIVPDTPGTIQVGRLRIYHSRAPMYFGAVKFDQYDFSGIPRSSSGLRKGMVWVDASAGNVIKVVT